MLLFASADAALILSLRCCRHGRYYAGAVQLVPATLHEHNVEDRRCALPMLLQSGLGQPVRVSATAPQTRSNRHDVLGHSVISVSLFYPIQPLVSVRAHDVLFQLRFACMCIVRACMR
eukprot:TRINITY_DN1568_c1_g3_i3.p6 TRINITY_DN1568_c1_g3~~TRINITY_DN1568_c1_g3_i3.p6  ORF type:complete len:118 (-),score=1.83 TRINITY_DN1568_c1_g3_i3:388-741(-)